MLMKSRSGGAKNKALGNPDEAVASVDSSEAPVCAEVKDGEQRWTSTNWREVGQFSSPN